MPPANPPSALAEEPHRRRPHHRAPPRPAHRAPDQEGQPEAELDQGERQVGRHGMGADHRGGVPHRPGHPLRAVPTPAGAMTWVAKRSGEHERLELQCAVEQPQQHRVPPAGGASSAVDVPSRRRGSARGLRPVPPGRWTPLSSVPMVVIAASSASGTGHGPREWFDAAARTDGTGWRLTAPPDGRTPRPDGAGPCACRSRGAVVRSRSADDSASFYHPTHRHAPKTLWIDGMRVFRLNACRAIRGCERRISQ